MFQNTSFCASLDTCVVNRIIFLKKNGTETPCDVTDNQNFAGSTKLNQRLCNLSNIVGTMICLPRVALCKLVLIAMVDRDQHFTILQQQQFHEIAAFCEICKIP